MVYYEVKKVGNKIMISKNDYIKKLVIDAFKTPIFNIQTTINTQSLIDYAYELKNKSKGRVISNVSGWQSDELDKDLPIFNELKNTINKFAQDLHEYIDLKKDSLNILDNIWFTNPNKLNEYHFDKDRVNSFNNYTSSYHWYEPKQSKLIIFPASLEHYVEGHMADEDRISIAFNTKLDNE